MICDGIASLKGLLLYIKTPKNGMSHRRTNVTAGHENAQNQDFSRLGKKLSLPRIFYASHHAIVY